MTKSSRITTFSAVGIVLVLLVVFVYGVFHGWFDNGKFEVEQTLLSPSKQIAMIARRYDNDALGGLQYFVVVGDHAFSSAELRHAYYYDGIVFRAGSPCLSIRWNGVHELTITCSDHSIVADDIAVQRRRVGETFVEYEGIPTKIRR